jgi:hypothetical protein
MYRRRATLPIKGEKSENRSPEVHQMSEAKNVRSPVYGRLVALCVVGAIVSLGVAQDSHAQGWTVDPIIRIAGEYDDNPTLDVRTDQEVNLKGGLLDVAATFDYNSQRTLFSVTPRLLWRSYPDNEEFESDDKFLRMAWRHNTTASTWALRLNYDDQSVRTGERSDVDLDAEDPDDIPENDSGRVAITGRRAKLRVRPSWSYNFSNTNSMSIGFEYIDAAYEDVFLGLLDDYQDSRVNLAFRHGFSNINTGIIQATGRRFETDDGLTEITGYGLQAGLERALSETTRVRAMVGFEDTELIDGSSDNNFVGDITLTRNLEIITMLVQYRRTITGTGRGRLSARESLSINFNRSLSEKVRAGLGVRAYTSSALNDPDGSNDRDYIQLRSRFDWFISPAFSIEFDYRYTMLNRENLGERANSNQVNLWLTYQPRRQL